MLRSAVPTWWHYDVLQGLEYLRRVGAAPERVAKAGRVKARRQRPVAARNPAPSRMPVETDEGECRPSRWNTSAPCACSAGTNRPVRKEALTAPGARPCLSVRLR
jgi:hypothetical protein